MAVRGNRGALVVAVSDGHGMKAAFRAHIGASIAVDVATEEALTRRKRWRAAVDDVGAADWLARDFTAAVVGGWRRRVRQHRATYPFTADELTFAGHVIPHSPTPPRREDATSDGETVAVNSETVELDDAEALIAYGATLLVAMATGQRVLAWQLGDGDLIASVGSQPAGPAVPGDPQLFGNRTTSLCLPGAEEEVRSSVLRLDDAPTLLVAASDGYGNAMAAEDWQARLGSDLH
ncbi:MAG: protein phosphatase 2C domain-containing protein, partial [Nocardioidaceae bacterium]